MPCTKNIQALSGKLYKLSHEIGTLISFEVGSLLLTHLPHCFFHCLKFFCGVFFLFGMLLNTTVVFCIFSLYSHNKIISMTPLISKTTTNCKWTYVKKVKLAKIPCFANKICITCEELTEWLMNIKMPCSLISNAEMMKNSDFFTLI